MHRGPIKRVGSLRQRLMNAQLAHLCVPRAPARCYTVPTRRFGVIDRLHVALIILVLQFVVVASGMTGSLRLLPTATRPSPALTSRVVPVAFRPAPEATPQNIEDLAAILMSEASPEVANTAERIAVAYTVLNRMQHSGTRSVRDVWSAYAHHAQPSDELRALASQILHRRVPDTSVGATHFYSPRSMPQAGQAVVGFDVGGGLEHTAGLTTPNYRPGWAVQYEPVPVNGVRSSHYKFYRHPEGTIQK